MSLLRFVHAADLHLDSPFSGLRGIAPEIAATLYQATFDAYDRLIALCIEERVDALLVAGDVFDEADRSLRAQLTFVEGLKRLDEAGIRSFICHGNHDPLDGWEAKLTLPSRCHRFGPNVEQIPVFADEPERAVVYGISYPQREVRDNLVPRFRAVASGGFSIGLLHTNVDNNTDHASYAPCSLSDLCNTGIDYWALGHVHTRQILHQFHPTVVYPGNPQGRHPNERGARGVYLVDVSDSGQVRTDFRPVDVVRWDVIQIDIGSSETEQELLNAIHETLDACQSTADGRSLVVRMILHGRGPLHTSLNRQGFVDDLLESVNGDWAYQRPFVWCERIQAATASPFDRESRRQGTDFLGDLLRLCDELCDNTETLSEMRESLHELYIRGNAARNLREFLPTDDELRELMTRAEELCIEELLDEDSE
jgi:DNA repair exonuclease SbcCD nuclease subunit